MARGFSHPNFGHEARIETTGCEVKLIFVANTPEQASELAHELLRQLKNGALNLTLMGTPSSIKGSLET